MSMVTGVVGWALSGGHVLGYTLDLVVLPQALVWILRNSSGLLSLLGERPRGQVPQ